MPDRLRTSETGGGRILLNRTFLVQLQMRLIALFGGEPGWRGNGRLDSVLEEARGRSDSGADLFELATFYTLRLADGPFLAANLQLTAVAVASFLRSNGVAFSPHADSLLGLFRQVRERILNEKELEAALRSLSSSSQSRPPPER